MKKPDVASVLPPEGVPASQLAVLLDGRPLDGLPLHDNRARHILYTLQLATRLSFARRTEHGGFEPVALDRVRFDDGQVRHEVASAAPPPSTFASAVLAVAQAAASPARKATT